MEFLLHQDGYAKMMESKNRWEQPYILIRVQSLPFHTLFYKCARLPKTD